MPELPFYFEVFCGTCKSGLCNQTETGQTSTRGMPFIRVDVCTNCQETAEIDGYDRGYDKGYDEGYKNGIAEKKE